MSDAHFTLNSKPIAFTKAAGLLGFATNGAAPQRVYGLYVDANLYGEPGEEPVESYWLKAVSRPDLLPNPAEGPYPEFIMFSSDLGQIEKVLGAIASASFVPGYDQNLPGKFDGYHNTAQTQHSDDTPEDCVEGLSCRVNSTDTAFEMRLFSKTTTVASVCAKLSRTGVDDALSVVSDLRQWRHEKLREIERIMKEEPSPAPGL